MLELSFREDVSLSSENGALQVKGQQFNWTTKKVSPGIKSALHMLAEGYVTEDQLLEKVTELDGPEGAIYFYQYLKRLSRLVCYALKWEGKPLATLVPFAPLSRYKFQDNLVQKEQAYALSRFAYFRKNERGQITAESPLGQASVILHGAQAGAMLAALAQPQRPSDLATTMSPMPEKTSMAFANLLLNAHIIGAVDENGRLAEETQPSLAQWEFSDLLFHKYTRLGWQNLPYGGTNRFKGQFEPLPLIKPDLPEETIDLYKPDLTQLAQKDMSFTAVLEQRRTIRKLGQEAMTVQQLGEFLYRTARIKKVLPTDPGDLDLSYRPYPAGGAIYELEIYPVIGACQGLPSGLYYYHPLNHQLHKISEKNQYTEALLYYAWMAATQQSSPQVLLVMTARFQRIQWKYESLPYALILKHVGVLQQTMYLAATAMGLAPCALGGGNSEIFARAAGLDYYAETSVGEFMLGSKEKTTHGDNRVT